MESNQEFRKKSGKSKSRNTSEDRAKSKDIEPNGGNKFEENLKEKLKERKIEPSAETWEKLDAKLNAEENKTSRKPWKYIAAAIAVLIVAGTFLWNPNTSESSQIVEEPVNEIIEKPKINKTENIIEVASEENNKEEKISAEKEIKNKVSNRTKPAVLAEKAPDAPVLEKVEIEEAVVLETINLEPPVSEEKLIQSKLEEIFASAAKNDEISEDEVDILLAEAASEISRERSLNIYATGNEINANALLAEVEDEIYQSFKAKVFEVLKEGYLKAKTAVANRNY